MNKFTLKGVTLLLVLVFTAVGCGSGSYTAGSAGKPKNVILIIGDGMGMAQLYSAMTVRQGKMNIEKARYIGFSKTHSYDNYVTDSAAGGTAMATGKKTRNGIIGLSPDSLKLTNMTELAHRKGLSAGVVSTSAVTHATPASFVAHNISRNNYEEIALDFLKTRPEVFIGGGLDHFSNREDGEDLVLKLEEMGYQVLRTQEELLEADGDKLAGLLAPEHLPTIAEGRGDLLAYSTLKALEALQKNPKGFFLMIEASQIDWAAHSHDTKYVVEETIDMDRTLGVVLDYAENLGETLVILTADHETGGMTLVTGDVESGAVGALYSVGGHTGIAVPVFAFGPSADEFTGFFENTDIFKKITRLLGL